MTQTVRFLGATIAAMLLGAHWSGAVAQVVDLSEPIRLESGFEYPNYEVGGGSSVAISRGQGGALAVFGAREGSALLARRLTPEGVVVGKMVQLAERQSGASAITQIALSDFDGSNWKAAIRLETMGDRLITFVVRAYDPDNPTAPIDEVVLYSSTERQYSLPVIAWNGFVHLVAWTEPEGTLHLARFDRDLSRVQEDRIVSGVDGAKPCELARDGSWLAWWTTDGAVLAQRLDQLGEQVGSQIRVQLHSNDAFGFAGEGDEAYIVWSRYRTHTLGISWLGTNGVTSEESNGFSGSAGGSFHCALHDGVAFIAWTDGGGAQALRVAPGGLRNGSVNVDLGEVTAECMGRDNLPGIDAVWLGERFAAASADGICQEVARASSGGCYPSPEPRVKLVTVPHSGIVEMTAPAILNGEGSTSVSHFFPASDGYFALSLDHRSNEQLHFTEVDLNGAPSNVSVRSAGWAPPDDPCVSRYLGPTRGQVWDFLPSVLIPRSQHRYSEHFTFHSVDLDLIRVDGAGHAFWTRSWPISATYDALGRFTGADVVGRGSRFYIAYGIVPPAGSDEAQSVRIRYEDTGSTEPISRWRFTSDDGIRSPTLGWSGGAPLAVWAESHDARWQLVTWSPEYSEPDISSGRILELGPAHQTTPELIEGPGELLCVYREAPSDGSLGASIRAVRVTPHGEPIGEAIDVSTLAGDQVSPTGIWNGAAYVIYWHESGSMDAYAQRVELTETPVGALGLATSFAEEILVARDVRSRGNPAAGPNGSVVLPFDDQFRILDDALVPTLPAMPSLSTEAAGVRIVWSTPSDVQRSLLYKIEFDDAVGAPSPPNGYTQIAEGAGVGTAMKLDREVIPGHSYAYVVGFEGPTGDVTFGPVATVTAATSPRLGLVAVASPSRERVRFRLDVPSPGGRADVRIFSPSGRVVREWREEWRAAGAHLLDWDGRDSAGTTAAAGLYFIIAELGPDRVATRAVLLR